MKTTLRKKRGKLTQKQLGQRVGISDAMISAIECGVKEPTLETALKLAKTLKTTVDKLFSL